MCRCPQLLIIINMWRFALALLLSAAVLGQTTTINVPTSMSTGNTKCSFSQNISFSDNVTNTLLTITYPPTNEFSGFVMLDGTPANSTTITLTKNYTSISICSFSATPVNSSPRFGVNTDNSTIANSSFGIDIRTMKQLNFTSTVTIPKSGCTAPMSATANDSLSALNVTIGLTGTTLYVVGGNTLKFTNTPTQTYKICSYDNATTGHVINAALTLSDASSTETITNVNQLMLTVGAFPGLNIVISNSSIAGDATSQQFISCPVSSNISGSFLYTVQELVSSSSTATKLTLA